MPVYAKNKLAVDYALPHTAFTLKPSGQEDSIVNVTAEVQNLTPVQRVDWQADQDAGKVFFYRSPGDDTPDFADLSFDNVITEPDATTLMGAIKLVNAIKAERNAKLS